MPTYEYHCATCAENFDVVQSFQDDPLTECPTCGSPVRKVFGSVGIVFKGSGFYKTDSRKGSSSSSSGDEKATPAADASSGPKENGASSGGSDSAGSDAKASPAPAKKESSGPPTKVAPEKKSGSPAPA